MSRTSRREQAVDSALRFIHCSLPSGNERLEEVLMQNGQRGVCRAYPDLPVSPFALNFNFVAAIFGFAFCHGGPQSAALPLVVQNTSSTLWVPVGAAFSKDCSDV